MNAIDRDLDRRLAHVRQEGRLAFVPFLVVGDPDAEGFLRLVEATVTAGADVLELGFPFSDPPADGPVIQAADARALRAGITTERAFELCAEVRRRHRIPISLLVYFNLVLQAGIENFYRRARESGVDAVLVADVPLELSEPLRQAATAHHVAPVFLASAVTTATRARSLQAMSEAYIYAAARVGITGVQTQLAGSALDALVRRLRGAGIELPVLAGFGLSRPEHVRAVAAAGADGAIVGSALVRTLAEHLPDIAAACDALSMMVGQLAEAARTSPLISGSGIEPPKTS